MHKIKSSDKEYGIRGFAKHVCITFYATIEYGETCEIGWIKYTAAGVSDMREYMRAGKVHQRNTNENFYRREVPTRKTYRKVVHIPRWQYENDEE